MAQKNTTNALAPVENFSLKTMYEDMDPELVEELRDQMGDLDDEQGIDCRKIKIPSGGGKSYEVEDDNDTVDMRTIRGVIVFTHRVNAYWETELGAAGSDENRAPTGSSFDGKVGTVDATGEVRTCDTCPMNAFGTSIKGGKGKACKNMRVLYLLRSGDYMPIKLSLSPTSIKPYTDFVNAAFISRRRGVCGSVVRIGLKKKNNGKDDYSVATFQRLYDFTGEELSRARAYANNFRQQIELILSQRTGDIEAEAGSGVEMERPAKVMPNNAGHFEVGTINGDAEDLPL